MLCQIQQSIRVMFNKDNSQLDIQMYYQNKLITLSEYKMLIKTRVISSPISPTHRSEISFQRDSTQAKTNQFTTMQKEHKRYKKINVQLQAMLKEQRLKYSELQQRMEMMKKRAALREKQFHNILVKTSATVNEWAHGYSDDKTKRQEVFKTFQRITSNFETVNEATNKFIEKRYIQNLNKAESKIAQIIQVAHDQLSELKKITQLDKLAIQRLLEQVCSTARKIDDQNVDLRERLANEELKANLLHEQKMLLLNQIVAKKRIINKLYLQNKQMKFRSNRDNQQQTQQLESILEKACADQVNNVGMVQDLPIKARYFEERSSKQGISTQYERRSGYNLSQKSQRNSQQKLGQFITQINLKKPLISTTPRRQKRADSLTITTRSYSKKVKTGESNNKFRNEDYDKKCQMQNNIDQLRVSMKKQKITVANLQKIITDYKFILQQIKQIVGQVLHIKLNDNQQEVGKQSAALTRIQKLLQLKKPNQSVKVLNNNFAYQSINNLIQAVSST